jgi:hypothetical protein
MRGKLMATREWVNVAARGVQQLTTLMSAGLGGRIALPELCE